METLNNLRNHMPLYERNNTLINEIFKVTAEELNETNAKVEQNKSELFIDTAIRALELYERDLGIKKNSALSLDQRREQIARRFSMMFEQITEKGLANMSGFYTDGSTDVERSDRRDGVYRFTFKDGTIPYDDEEFQKMLYTVMPAYLAWEISSRSDINTYSAIASKSGMKVKIYEEG